jgi:Na+/melibiose symporter-like transporter
MISRSTSGLERDSHETAWLVTARLLWLVTVLSAAFDVPLAMYFASDPNEGPVTQLALFGLVPFAFAFFSYRVLRRVNRGPQSKLSRPHLSYLGNFLLAQILAWFLHVFGIVYGGFGVPLTAVYLVFFVPSGFLLLMNVPTRGKLRAWTHSSDSEQAP